MSSLTWLSVEELERDKKLPLFKKTLEIYEAQFKEQATGISYAPGRVEILGNHTDYNGGHVMSVALDVGTAVAFKTQSGTTTHVYSDSFQKFETFEVNTEDRASDPNSKWTDYIKGALREVPEIILNSQGANLAVVTDLPMGSGLSSSASLTISTLIAGLILSDQKSIEPMDLAQRGQHSEVEFVGMPCGLLDQFSSVFGRENHLLYLDCEQLTHDAIPLTHEKVVIVIADSGIRHQLVDGEYAKLKASCERACKELGTLLDKPLRFLRDVSSEEFFRVYDQLDPQDRRRAKHVILENERVLLGKEIASQNTKELGRLMVQSHESSRDDFGNSCRELDLLVEIAQKLPGFLGGKLSGGGFGGSAVFLVNEEESPHFIAGLKDGFESVSTTSVSPYKASIGDCARGYRWA